MLLAQLHNKLTRSEEESEDLLTSNVFGAFKYSGNLGLLCRFLSGARLRRGSGPILSLGDASACKYRFWPPFPGGDEAGCEPDLVLRFDHTDGSRSLIAIEAKYRSGKSSRATSDGDVNDQLAREWLCLRHEAQRLGCARFALVYLTADVGMPKADIDEAIDELDRKRGITADVAWLSWRRLPRLLDGAAEPILRDLDRLLRRAMLVEFEGVDLPRSPCRPPYLFLESAGAATSAPTLSQAYTWSSPPPVPAYAFNTGANFCWALPRLSNAPVATTWRFVP